MLAAWYFLEDQISEGRQVLYVWGVRIHFLKRDAWMLRHLRFVLPEIWIRRNKFMLFNSVISCVSRSPLSDLTLPYRHYKEIKSVSPKGNQPWIFTGRTNAEADAPILWPPDAKSWLIGKDPNAGKNWGQKKQVAEDEMVGWHHWLNGQEFKQTLGDSEG